jgi:hypothetical protein
VNESNKILWLVTRSLKLNWLNRAGKKLVSSSLASFTFNHGQMMF